MLFWISTLGEDLKGKGCLAPLWEILNIEGSLDAVWCNMLCCVFLKDSYSKASDIFLKREQMRGFILELLGGRNFWAEAYSPTFFT